MKPLVSIITPCYNSEDYLVRYLNNILGQTYSKIELIIVNDGSTDNTEQIALSYVNAFQEKGYSLVYVKQDNKGLGGAINTGLKYITGEYFTWCDSDNFYTDDYVAKKVDFFLKNPQYSIVRCDGYIVNDSDIHTPIATFAEKNTDKFKENLFEECLYRSKNFHYGCAMFRTADFDRINRDREIYPSREGQNWQLLLPMLYHYKAGYIDKQMFYFVHRSASISNSANTVEKKILQEEEYQKIILLTIESMKIEEKQQYLLGVKDSFAIRLFRFASYVHDFKRLKSCYRYLKKRKKRSKEVKKIYRRSHFSKEYLIYIRHKFFG